VDGAGLAAKPESPCLTLGMPKSHDIEQVGYIYTAQGFEFDYMGVIFGRDLWYDPKTSVWIGNPWQSHDTVVMRARESFTVVAKYIYRVLFTRGIKDCYVYVMDEPTQDYFQSRIDRQRQRKILFQALLIEPSQDATYYVVCEAAGSVSATDPRGRIVFVQRGMELPS
jgi:hypothetical protein